VSRLSCPEMRWPHEGQEASGARENSGQGGQSNLPKLKACLRQFTDDIVAITAAAEVYDTSQNRGQGWYSNLAFPKIGPWWLTYGVRGQ
jgi:hypothetical protein